MKKDKKIRRELLDELLAGYSKPEDLTGPQPEGTSPKPFALGDP